MNFEPDTMNFAIVMLTKSAFILYCEKYRNIGLFYMEDVCIVKCMHFKHWLNHWLSVCAIVSVYGIDVFTKNGIPLVLPSMVKMKCLYIY